MSSDDTSSVDLQSQKQVEQPERLNPSFSHRSTSSNTRRANSTKEVGFIELGSKGTRYGSRASGSGSMSLSQREIRDEDSRLIYPNDPESFEFTGNSIRTSKYSVLTFLPRNLFEQFHRVAYIYFHIIAVLNQLPQLAVFEHKKWKHVQVGEIIKIYSNETIPCDIVLLSTSDPTGVAYIQTINLDGESNLKTRYAKQETLSRSIENEKNNGVIKCEKPNRNIYGFLATLDVDQKRVSLGPSNIVLRGCVLKNTSWAVGVVVYTGMETKVMLNNSGAQ